MKRRVKKKPLRSLTEKETLRAIRDSLIISCESGHWIRITGHEEDWYTDKDDATERLEEILAVRPFTFQVGQSSDRKAVRQRGSVERPKFRPL